ncbi:MULTISPECIES: NAD(P)-dependent alcohol dehydrogenase [Rhodococcus]|uniref:alcohol dehydrogenase n=1 Tax=Rhodococcus oxybenzonivorans TaxID=1990687 RepID=A0AAE5A8S9_9NOCA|nr:MULTISPECIES: NAD(P)-dependent alcohol dehydrogenase [Rhodococcus]MDV7241172.1 NAD(P)-dependent alcohol dehydrogenase [Rhodococcus oxybenzonivorans]MDV7267876.1 NAD(P)-dependent alcohol dehydrogenase [Rhodococcus oxybenzonivorans]MDV7273445.1 NAD(P)-dependent alcohol dehydrogenase [Rhodococcus oxybenzonivorans]MDV7332817.1 NAD(P)-dependent alcohol dehydrogenase [Rhodococcus oxybenzonivorans]MDV7341983.1 NAD(P)-dependent alcohol dehydrogenase [Rhodococcus oxybenzonivorans]
MKAVQVVGYHTKLQLTDIPEPTIEGPFDVIVRIGGAGVCRTDLHVLEGQWEEKSGVALPYTIGHENAGWVHAVGDAVTNVVVGDKVILHPLITCGLCRACRFGDDVHCQNSKFPGIDTNGGYAEYLRTTARSVVRIDDSLEPADVAALADAGLTAYHAVAKVARTTRPGDVCVVIGAGGLGHIGIQVLKAISGVTVVVLDRNPAAVDLAVKIGADHGIVADGTHIQQVLDLTGGHGAEAVVDFVGEGGATAEGVAMLRRAGNYYVVGYGENLDVPTIDVISTEINFIGNLVGSYNDLQELMILAAQGKVTLHTTRYRLEDFQQALDDLDAGRVRGRAILVP